MVIEEAENIIGFYNDVKKIMFINIPKNASSSLRDGLSTSVNGRLSELDDFENYTIVSSIRNPLDRIVSQYNEVKKRAPKEVRELNFFNMKEGSREKFVEFLQEIKRGCFDVHVIKQSDCLCGENGDIFDIDYLILFDELENDFNKIKENLGLDVNLPHKKPGGPSPYLEMVNSDEEIKRLVLEIYSKDWEIYNTIKNGRE